MSLPTFEQYLASLGRLSLHVDPTVSSPASVEISEAAASLASLPEINLESITAWIVDNPLWVPVLGLAVGLSQEKLKNSLRDVFDTSSWTVLARRDAKILAEYLDSDFDLIRSLSVQRGRTYDFGDVLVARAGTRASAIRAGASGRKVEDEIEAIAADLGLTSETRTKFVGRNNRTAPCDLAIPSGHAADIVVAAKGFDSTGSKLTDAVREIEEMADVRLSRQFVVAVIDGIGWKSRKSDLNRIYKLWESNQIDGMYTLASLGDFRTDIEKQAKLRGLLPT